MKQWRALSPGRQLVLALVGASLVSVGLWVVAVFAQHRTYEWYLSWNLFLSWLPLLFAWQLLRTLKVKSWSSWEGIAWTFLWLTFLPNSFYMVSDFIHLREVPLEYLLYDNVMFASFIFCALALGFASLYLVHQQLRKRLSALATTIWIGSILLLCSFAIYLGRNLRWNSWDILLNPAGLLFDVSDRILHPTAHPQTYTLTLSFFVLLVTFYALSCQVIYTLSHRASSDIIGSK